MIKPLIYKDIDPTRYLISDKGEVWLVKNGKRLFGCKPEHEHGYLRYGLQTKDGTNKKYHAHRLVKAVFDHESDLPIDHVNCNKLCNELWNLEYVTSAENLHRASVNGLMLNGEQHHFATLTEKQVRDACKLFEKGYNVRKVAKELNLSDVNNITRTLTCIVHRQTWTQVSKDYNWELDDVRLKVYKHNHLLTIAKLLLTKSYKHREIAKMFPQYDEDKLVKVIKKMNRGKLYKSIIKEAERSTTIGEGLLDGDDFIILKRKKPLGASAPKEQDLVTN